MHITIYNRTNEDVHRFKKDFDALVKEAKKYTSLTDEMMISVTFVRSRTMHMLNQQYRNIDRPTDVISFAIQDAYTVEDTDDLGDVFINIDYARKQARAYGHSYRREICFLFVHGLLHCLGYDHMNEKDEKKMFTVQEQILSEVVKR